MKSSMKKNATIATPAFKANAKKTHALAAAYITKDSQNLKNKAIVNLDDMSIDEKVVPMSHDEKQDIIVSIIDQIENLEKQVEESKEWANRIAMDAMKKISNDMTELKMLKIERTKTQKLIKEKLALDDRTSKKTTYVKNILRSTTVELEQAHGYLRRLETQNAEIKAEIEACKLSASKSNTASLKIAKREKKALKKTQALEKQLTKLQMEISEGKKKTLELEKVLAEIIQSHEEIEAKLNEELKATNEAKALVITEQLLKEVAEAKINKKKEETCMKIEIEFQHHKDDVHKLEPEISSAKVAARAKK